METKFTKGNWHPVNYAGRWTIQTEPFYDDSDDLLNSEDFPEKQCEANALLMSKSPELLETLHQCISLIKGSNTDCFSWPDRIIAKELIQRAEQLIIDATTI